MIATRWPARICLLVGVVLLRTASNGVVNKHVLVLGDSQCELMGPYGFYSEVTNRITQVLRASSMLDDQAQVDVTFDCLGGRVLATLPVLGDQDYHFRSVATYAQLITSHLCHQSSALDMVIVMGGINELKQHRWQRGSSTWMPDVCSVVSSWQQCNSNILLTLMPPLKPSVVKVKAHTIARLEFGGNGLLQHHESLVEKFKSAASVCCQGTCKLAPYFLSVSDLDLKISETHDGVHYVTVNAAERVAQRVSEVGLPSLCRSALVGFFGAADADSLCASGISSTATQIDSSLCFKALVHQLGSSAAYQFCINVANGSVVVPSTGETPGASGSGGTKAIETESSESTWSAPKKESSESIWSAPNAPNAFCNGSLNSSNAHHGLNGTDACVAVANAQLWRLILGQTVPYIVLETLMLMIFVNSNPQTCELQGEKLSSKAIQGMRVVAAVHILLFHIFQTLTINGKTFSCNFCGFGKYWVQAFFLISGFVLARSEAAKGAEGRSSIGTFLFRRISSIYPLYLISIIVALAQHLHFGGEVDVGEVAASVFMVQAWYPPFHYGHLNGPAWFVSNLVIFWTMFPHWFQVACRASIPALISLLAFCYLSSYMPTCLCYVFTEYDLFKRWYKDAYLHEFIEFHPLCNWPSFAIGLLWAVLLQRINPALPWLQWTKRFGATLTLVGMFFFFTLAPAPGFDMGRYKLLFDKGPLSFPVFLVLITAASSTHCCDKWGGQILISLAPFANLGWPLYILHLATAQFLVKIAGWIAESEQSPYAQLWLLPMLHLVVAFIGYLCVDIPTRTLSKNLLQPKSGPTADPMGDARQVAFDQPPKPDSTTVLGVATAVISN